MRMSRAKRLWLRKHPAPEPPPEGTVYISGHEYPAEELQTFLARHMERYDALAEQCIKSGDIKTLRHLQQQQERCV